MSVGADYFQTREALVPPTYSLAALVDSYDWNAKYPDGGTIRYSFDISTGTEAAEWQASTPPLSAFNTAQRDAARTALASVTALTGIQFSEVASGTSADWHFANQNISGPSVSGLTWTHYAYQTRGGVVTSVTMDSYIYLDNVEWRRGNENPAVGSSGFETLLHEIGHALGLKHPFEGDYQLPEAEDNTDNTLMSYTEHGLKSSFQAYDVAALRYIYGTDGLGGYGIGPNSTGVLLNNQSSNGGSGNDLLTSGPGNDVLDGGAGTDTVRFSGNRTQYTIASGNGSLTVSGPDGTDTLLNIERLKFTDGTLALSAADVAGQAFRLYRAALGRTPDAGGLGYQTNRLDQGTSLENVGAGFIASPEFQQKYGTLSSSDYVTQLYQNVLGRGAGASEIAYYVNRLDGGASRQAVLIGFSESPENIANTASLTANGIWFA